MTRLARLSTTLVVVALSLCLGLVPMTESPVLSLAITLCAVSSALLIALAVDELSHRRHYRKRVEW